MPERLADDDRRAREGAVDIALPVASMEQHLVRRECLVQGGDGRQRLPVDRDQLPRVGPEIWARGDHGGHRLAREPRDAVGQRGPCRRGEPLALEPGRERLRHRPQLVAGDDRENAGQRSGRRRVDSADPRVRVGAPSEAHG